MKPVVNIIDSLRAQYIMAKAVRKGWKVEVAMSDDHDLYYRVYKNRKMFYKVDAA
jgi:hypothetical protein